MIEEREVVYMDVDEVLGNGIELQEVNSMEDAINAVKKNEEEKEN